MLDSSFVTPGLPLGENFFKIRGEARNGPASKPVQASNFDCIKLISEAAQSFFDSLNTIIEPIQQVVFFKNLMQVIKLPFSTFSIVNLLLSMPTKNLEKKIDAGLDVGDKLREIGESAGTFAIALETFKIVPISTLEWTMPYTIAMSILSIPSVIIKFRTCLKAMRVIKSFDNIIENGKVKGRMTSNSYQTVVNLIEEKQSLDDQFIHEMFNETQEKLGNALVDLKLKADKKIASNRPKEIEEGQKLIESGLTALKGRVKQTFIATSIAMTASLVNIVGTAILLAIPIQPLGWALLGIGAVVNIGQFIYHKVGEYQFASALDIKRTKWEWLTC
jgi:hypothetical protein